MATIQEQITTLEGILGRGQSEIDVDGTRVKHDLEEVRRRLNELKRLQNTATRPRVAQINLGGF